MLEDDDVLEDNDDELGDNDDVLEDNDDVLGDNDDGDELDPDELPLFKVESVNINNLNKEINISSLQLINCSKYKIFMQISN